MFLLACASSGGDATPVMISTTSNTVNGWTAFYSPGVTLAAAPGALFSIAIPGNSPTVCPSAAGACTRLGYVQKAAPALKTGQTITMTGSVQATPDAVFNYTTNPDNPTTASGHPAACRIHLQEAGDTGSGTDNYAYYRWWANDPSAVVLQNGSFSVSVVLSAGAGGGWTSVMGKQATNSAATTAAFNQAVANAQYVGFTCGGGSFYGHGVNMSQGTATFILKSYTVN